jgi:uncharacterized protein (AIM24 family)
MPNLAPASSMSIARRAALARLPTLSHAARRINISATASSSSPALDPHTSVDAALTPVASPGMFYSYHHTLPFFFPFLPTNPPSDARFDVIGTPFSLLSVSLAASQTLFTRRGTLVGLSGKPENTLSTLSVLEPFRRAPVGIPFLYQKVSATSPVTALVSTKSPISSIVSVHLDGRQDWIISQRQALLAWTGHTLSLKPQYNVKLGLAHWGNTYITGRGLLALAGSGQIYQVQLKAGESYVAHPRYVRLSCQSSPH